MNPLYFSSIDILEELKNFVEEHELNADTIMDELFIDETNPPLSQVGTNLLTYEKFHLHKSHKEKTHSHIIGASRFGKSNYLTGQIMEDIQRNDCGVAVLDPHGALYKDIRNHLAMIKSEAERKKIIDRIVLLEPANPLINQVGFNPIPPLQDLNVSYVAECITNAFFLVWIQNPNEYPRIFYWLNTLFYMTVKFQKKISEIFHFMSDNDFRWKYLDQLNQSDEHEYMIYKSFLEFEGLHSSKKSEFTEGIKNRLNPFISNDTIRNVLNCSSGIDFQKAMKEGKIVLMNLNGEQGDLFQLDQTRLLGNLIINEIVRVAKKRDPDNPEIKPFYVYIDEVGEMPSNILAEALSGLAKRKVLFNLAHQEMSQIKILDQHGQPKFYNSVLANCQNKVVFGGLHWRDAEEMSQEMPELITLDKHKEYLYELSTLPYEDWTPKSQTVIESTESYKEDESKKVSQSFQQQKTVQVTGQDNITFQIQKSDSNTQSQEIAKSLNKSKEFSSRQALVHSLAQTRAKSSINTFTDTELNQMARILGTHSTKTNTEQERKALSHIVANANSRTNEHLEGNMIANFVLHKNSKENRESLASSIQTSLENLESEIQSESNTEGSTDIESKGHEEFSSVTDTQVQGDSHVHKSGESHDTAQMHGNVNERGKQTNSGSTQYSGDGKDHTTDSTGKMSSETTRDINQNTQTNKFMEGSEDVFKSESNHATANGTKKTKSQTKQLSQAMANTLQNVVSKSKREIESETKTNTSATAQMEENGEQNTKTVSDIVREALQEITTQQEQETTEKIKSHALAKIEQDQQSKAISKIQSDAEQEVLTGQNSQNFQASINNAISQIESLQKRGSVSALTQVAVSEMRSKARALSMGLSKTQGLQLDQTLNISAGHGTTVKRMTTEELKVRHAQYTKMTPKTYILEEEQFLQARLIKNQPVGYAYIKRFQEDTVPVKVDEVLKPKVSREELSTKIKEFQESVVTAHPELYFTKNDPVSLPIKDITPQNPEISKIVDDKGNEESPKQSKAKNPFTPAKKSKFIHD